MALFITNTSKITGRGTHLFSDVTSFLLNGEGVFGLTDDNVTESVFLFNLNLEDDREGSVRIESTASSSSVATAINLSIASTFIPLTVYEEANPSSNTATESFLTKNICFGYNFESGSILYVRSGSLLKRIMATATIESIIAYVATTTTTSTSTTSTSSTSTSSTSTSSTSTSSTSSSTTSTTTVIAGDFRATSGEALYSTRIRLITTEVPFIPTFVAGEFEILEGGEEIAITSFSIWPSGFDINVTGLQAGSAITVTYSGSSAESTFGTPLDTFTLMSMVNNVAPPSAVLFDDGSYYFRLQVRTCLLNMDQTMTGTGFAGTEGVDWDDILNYDLP